MKLIFSLLLSINLVGYIFTIYKNKLLTKTKKNFLIWWAEEDLNFRPHAYQARALTN